jgi:hypothetical protein
MFILYSDSTYREELLEEDPHDIDKRLAVGFAGWFRGHVSVS